MSKAYRQFPRRRGPVIPIASQAPYLSYWVLPVNEPLRSRVPKRQQPPTPQPPPLTFSEAPYLPYWKQPVNEPLKNRVPKRQIPNKAEPPYPAAPSQAPYVSCWKQPVNEPQKQNLKKLARQQPQYPLQVFDTQEAVEVNTNWLHPVNQPLKSRVPKRLQVPKAQPPYPNIPSEAPYLSYWKQPVNQPLRNRVPKRLQVNRILPNPPQGSEAPYITYWLSRYTQIVRRQRRQQPPSTTQNPFYSLTQAPAVPSVTSWIHPTNQPRNRKIKVLDSNEGSFSSVTEAPYLSYWKQPVNQPLKGRVPKRQQPAENTPPPLRSSAAPYLSYWVLPISQPLRSRTPKRQQPQSTIPNPFYGIPPAAAPSVAAWIHPINQPVRRKRELFSIGGGDIGSVISAPYLSYWKQPTNEPLKSRVPKRLQVNKFQPPYPNIPSEAPYISYWAQPTNQPLRNRISKRQQPRYSIQFYPPIASEPPYLSYWKQPINQPRIVKKRQQPPVTPNFWAVNQPFNSILVSQWYKPTNQPLRNRIPKRQQPRYSVQFMPPLPSQAPYLSYWKQPTSEPRIVKKRQQPAPITDFFIAPTGLQNAPFESWQRPVNQPVRKTKRQQPRQQAAPTQPIRSWMSLGGKPIMARKTKRQQPSPVWNPWYATIPNANLVSQWKRGRDIQLTPKRKRQQPTGNTAWNYANIYPYFKVPLESWKQPVNQPLRRSRPAMRYIPNQVVIVLASLAIRSTLPMYISPNDETIYLGSDTDQPIILGQDEEAVYARADTDYDGGLFLK